MTALSDTHPHGEHEHEHPPYLAHHWDNPAQQFNAGKLGMWLFLATEILLFGGLFCGYAVWRANHPEVFSYGSRYLDTMWGAINTVVLILSSLTMAWGVTAAQQNKQGLLKIMLVLTLLGAGTFLGIKYVEYSHKIHEGWLPGPRFYNAPDPQVAHTWKQGVHPVTGKLLPLVMPPMALPATQTAFAGAGETRPPADAPTISPAAIGPQGMRPDALERAEADIDHGALAPMPASNDHAHDDGHAHEDGLAHDDGHDHGQAATASAGHDDAHGGHGGPLVHPLQDSERPRNAHMFFNIYFMMTGLHGIHVVIGMIVITWLLIRTFKGHFSAEYFTPVDLGGLYWHVVDLIWIFLFPLFYLIH